MICIICINTPNDAIKKNFYNGLFACFYIFYYCIKEDNIDHLSTIQHVHAIQISFREKAQYFILMYKYTCGF